MSTINRIAAKLETEGTREFTITMSDSMAATLVEIFSFVAKQMPSSFADQANYLSVLQEELGESLRKNESEIDFTQIS